MTEVSVIISAHKDRGFLDECIQSVLAQKFSLPYQIILSSDGNSELKSYADKYGIEFVLSGKGNHSTALNHAVSVAEGEWIKEVHDDDLLTPNSLQSLWDARGGDIVYANARNLIKGVGRAYRSPRMVDLSTFYPKMTNPIHGGTLMFRRDTFLRIGGFDPKLEYAEEYEFYFNLLSKGCTFRYCDSVVAVYRVHRDRQTQSFTPAIQRQIKHYIEKKYEGYLHESIAH